MLGETPSFTVNSEPSRLLTALRESELLRELAELLASSFDLQRILHVVTKRTTEVCEVERCSVWLTVDTQNVFRPTAYHLSTQRLKPEQLQAADQLWSKGSLRFDDPEVYRLLLEQGSIVVDDLRIHPATRPLADVFLVRSVLLIALKREGRLVGLMTLDDPTLSRSFSLSQQQLACAIGQQAAVAIDNARLYEEAQNERKRASHLIARAQAIYQVAMAVNAGTDLPTVLEIATQNLVRYLNAQSGASAFLEAEALRVACLVDLERVVSPPNATLCLSDIPACQEAASSGQPLYTTTHEAGEAAQGWYQELGFEHILIVPLFIGTTNTSAYSSPSHTGQTASACLGFVLVNYSAANYHLSGGQLAFAQDIAALCALAIDKARLLADVQRTAALATERANTLNAVFQSMTEGISVLNQEGEVVVSNTSAARFIGVPVNSKEHLSVHLQRHPPYTLDGQPIAYEDFPLVRAMRGERIRGERVITTRADGAERALEMNVTAIFDDRQQQIGIVSAFRDITEQIRVEGRIRQALDTMLHVVEAISGITEIKDILHSVLAKALTTLHCDRGMIQLYEKEERVFRPLLTLGLSKEEESVWLSEQGTDSIAQAIKRPETWRQLMQGHASMIATEGCKDTQPSATCMKFLAAPITYNNHVLGLMLLNRSPLCKSTELLEKKQREFSMWDMAIIEGIAQLAGLAIEQARWQVEATNARTSEAAMREANVLKDEFLAITAHEFRTPLTVILAHCQVSLRLLRRLQDAEPFQRVSDSLAVIQEQTRQLTNIVNTFLEVTQINRGRLTLNAEVVDLADIVRLVVSNIIPTASNHQLSYSIEPSSQPPLVLGDMARLEQILANLLQNAIKYSPLGGPISVSLRQVLQASHNAQAQRIIEVCVQDAGIGIPQDVQPYLFERFYRAPNASAHKTRGIGLGLYVVAQLLHLHGGTIRVESSGALGEGSRFIFTLPALESSNASDE